MRNNNIVTMDDWKLVQSLEKYLASGNIEFLRKECCVWILQKAKRMGAGEDDSAEVVLKFLENISRYLAIFAKGNYPEFPPFLSSVTRHLVFNQRKLGKNKPGDFYLSLWNEGRSAANNKRDILVHYSDEIEKGIMSLPGQERVILKLKSSMNLDPSDTREIRRMLKNSAVSLAEFLQDYRNRFDRRLVMKDAFLTRMNHYNKKIMIHGNSAYKQSKIRLLKRLEGLDQLYSFRELGDVFGINPRIIGMLYQNAIRSLEKKLSRLKEEY